MCGRRQPAEQRTEKPRNEMQYYEHADAAIWNSALSYEVLEGGFYSGKRDILDHSQKRFSIFAKSV